MANFQMLRTTSIRDSVTDDFRDLVQDDSDWPHQSFTLGYGSRRFTKGVGSGALEGLRHAVKDGGPNQPHKHWRGQVPPNAGQLGASFENSADCSAFPSAPHASSKHHGIQENPRLDPSNYFAQKVLHRLDAVAEAQAGFESLLHSRLSALEAANCEVLDRFTGMLHHNAGGISNKTRDSIRMKRVSSSVPECRHESVWEHRGASDIVTCSKSIGAYASSHQVLPNSSSRPSADHEMVTMSSTMSSPSTNSRAIVSFDAEVKSDVVHSHDDDLSTVKDSLTLCSPNLNTTTLSYKPTLEDQMPARICAARRCVTSPESKKRTAFDVLCCLVVGWDSLTIPFVLAWQPDVAVIKAGMLFTSGFWVLDLLSNFFTGYYENGNLQMQFSRICRHYIKGWFIVDMVLVVLDLLSVGLEFSGSDVSGSGAFGFLRVGKVYRFARMVAWLRLSKAWTRLEHLSALFLAEKWQILGQVAKLFLLIMWLNHAFCCCWFAIANEGWTDTGITWLDDTEPSSTDGFITYGEQSVLYQYTTAYHWALTQMTPGSMQVVPRNSAERILNIICLLIGLLFVTSAVSRMSAKMVQLQMLQQEQMAKLAALRRYLKEHNIPSQVAHRICCYCETQLGTKKPLLEEDVPVLLLLSPSLKASMRHCMFARYLLQNPFLRLWDMFDVRMVRECCRGTELMTAAEGTEVFGPRLIVAQVLVLIKGRIRYVLEKDLEQAAHDSVRPMDMCPHASQDSMVDSRGSMMSGADEVDEMVPLGTWMSEGAFWTKWITKGTAETMDRCEMICVDVAKVRRVVRRNLYISRFWDICKEAWREYMKKCPETLSDLPVEAEHQKVILHMPVEARTYVARPIIESMKSNDWSRWIGGLKMVKELEAELQEGKCAFLVDVEGTPERVVMLATLQISRLDQRILAQVAETQDGELSPLCQLPGKKVGRETPQEALEKLMRESLSSLVTPPELGACTATTAEKKMSPSYGMNTWYLKSSWHVVITEDQDMSAALNYGSSASVSVLRNNLDGSDRSQRLIAVESSLKLGSFHSSKGSNRSSVEQRYKQGKKELDMHDLPTHMYAVQSKKQTKVYAWLFKYQYDSFCNEPDLLRQWVEQFKPDGRMRVSKRSA